MKVVFDCTPVHQAVPGGRGPCTGRGVHKPGSTATDANQERGTADCVQGMYNVHCTFIQTGAVLM